VGVVHHLVTASADVDAENNDGATALMLATYAQKEHVVRSLLAHGARQGLAAALAFAEQAGPEALTCVLRDASPASRSSLGWMSTSALGWLGWSGAAPAACDQPGLGPPAVTNENPLDLGFVPLALGLMVVGCMLLLFQLDVDNDGPGALTNDGGVHERERIRGLGADALDAPLAGHRGRRETTDLSQLRARERRSLSSRLGEAYQRWNETEGQREAKLHQQRKRVAKQAKLQEEASAVAKALVEALKLAEQAVVVVRRPQRAHAGALSVPVTAPSACP